METKGGNNLEKDKTAENIIRKQILLFSFGKNVTNGSFILYYTILELSYTIVLLLLF